MSKCLSMINRPTFWRSVIEVVPGRLVDKRKEGAGARGHRVKDRC